MLFAAGKVVVKEFSKCILLAIRLENIIHPSYLCNKPHVQNNKLQN